LQITILGASGQIGQAAVKEALKSGYQIKVLVRSLAKLGDLKNGVTVIQGDLADSKALGEALRGSEAVLNLAGGVKESDQAEKFKRIAGNLVEQMNQQGIKRLINISGAVTTLSGEKPELKRKIMKIMVSLFFKQMQQAQEAFMPVIEKADFISWTFVRPAMISKGPVTGKIKTDDKKLPGTKVTLGDLSWFIVDQITSTEWIKKAPMITSV
jgi:putative NADH-flavin reductase